MDSGSGGLVAVTEDVNMVSSSDQTTSSADEKATTSPEHWSTEADLVEPEVKVSDEDEDEASTPKEDGVGAQEMDTQTQADLSKKKTKSKSKSKMTKGLGKPTGFEEFYAEAPMTPVEVQETIALYDSNIPVDERIQTAVQRFCARRKFDSGTKDVFDRYLTFGGIDSGPKMFGGGDDPDAGELTATEIAALKHPKYLTDAVLNGEMVIDFDGVLKAYLSSYSAMWFTLETEPEIKRRVNVIRSFLNYLLRHEVCPEYKGQLEDAKQTCDVGEAQLWLVSECAKKMPGDFNIACSVLFHGWYHDAYIHELSGEQPDEAHTRIVAAKNTFLAALASHGSASMVETYSRDNEARKKQPVRKFSTGLEVVRIEFATHEVKKLYKMDMFQDCKRTGKMTVQKWINPASMPEDLSDDEDTGTNAENDHPTEFVFLIDEEVLATVFTGMKFEATVYELTFGLYFFETPTNFRCSFYKFLPNEAMIGYKEHVYLEPRAPCEPVKAEAKVFD